MRCLVLAMFVVAVASQSSTTTEESTTAVSSTTVLATVSSTTETTVTVASTTTEPSTTTAPVTIASTTTEPTTVASTTVPPVTVPSTTVPPVTVPSTTVPPVTVASTTVAPVTVASTTASPTTAVVAPGACPIASAPGGAAGATYTVTFTLEFATFNCATTFAAWTQLWNRALPLRLLSATAGSVVFRIFADDAGTPGAAQARFNELSAALADPNSAESRQAVALGIPVRSTAQDTPVNVGIIVGAVLGVLLLAGLILLIVVLVMRHRRGRGGFTHYDEKLSAPLLDRSLPATHEPVIGSPFNMTHDKGESQVLTRLVSLNDAKAKRDSELLLPESAPGAAIGGGGGGANALRRFRLLADIRDVGEAVLTGVKMGTQGTVEPADLTTSDWIWATLEGRSGWVPRNHMQLE